ncbi:MAG TPA: Ig-like domain-containing protein [Oscillatoriaceae cyanobacterium]
MRSTIYSLLAGTALVVSACASTGVNSADIYHPQSGTVQLQAQTSDTTIQSVDFALNQQPIGTGTPVAGGWTVNLNTTQFQDGFYNLTATGVTSAGTQVQLLNNTLFINNGTSGASGTVPPESSSGSETASDTQTASGASFFIPASTKTPPWL